MFPSCKEITEAFVTDLNGGSFLIEGRLKESRDIEIARKGLPNFNYFLVGIGGFSLGETCGEDERDQLQECFDFYGIEFKALSL